jgi:predicted nucleotidyltransferase
LDIDESQQLPLRWIRRIRGATISLVHLPRVTVWACGSRFKGTARPNSDLDLVVFATPAQRPQVSELKDALDQNGA